MRKNRIINNIIKVAISNGIILLASLFANFCLPNMMEIGEYGLYKEFTLYFSYCGLLHLGFIDGMYVKYGGMELAEINQKELNVFTTFFYIFQFCMLFIALAISCILNTDNRFFIISLAIMGVLNNITTFYQYLSQATERFDELTVRNIIKAILQILVIIILLMLVNLHIISDVHAKLYIVLTVFTTAILTFWYERTYQCFSFSMIKHISKDKKPIIKLFSKGFPILIAGSISNLILISDRQFAVIYSNNEDYAIYAFAYSIAALLITLVSTVSIVLFPSIKRINENYLRQSYNNSMTYILSLAFGFGVFFQVISLVISLFVPKYVDSVRYIYFLMPAMILNIVISSTNTNFYKALGMNKKYLQVSVIVFIFAIISNYLSLVIIKDLIGLTVASVLTFFVWYFLSTRDIAKRIDLKVKRFFVYAVLMICTYYFSYRFFSKLLGTVIYLLIWIVGSVILIKMKNKL